MNQETYYTNPSRWRDDLAYNVFVPILCDDLINLQSYSRLLKAHRIKKTFHSSFTQYFFGNHPIRWCRVVGKVVHVETLEQASLCVFHISDGFSGTSLQCVMRMNSNSTNKLPTCHELVVVFGEVSQFGGEIQVNAQRVLGYPKSEFLRYYCFREEALLVRKYFLERSANEFKLAVKPVATAKLTISEVNCGETAGIRKLIARRVHDWGLDYKTLTEDPLWEYP